MEHTAESAICCRTLEEVALLDRLGLREYAGTETQEGETVILFRDPTGEARDALRRN
ncbi:hypothetical protein HQ520_03905 [bacterium]|nr:hypothetical protein [bacterium]